MNKLRYIALALCAVMALGLICGCNDTKPVGTVSDGASSEDSILSKTGKLSEDEMIYIASYEFKESNALAQFLTVDCYEKYTDRSKKVTISSIDYYKVTADGKYNFKRLQDISGRGSYFIKYTYQLFDMISHYEFPFEMKTDNGEVLYSSGGLSPAFMDFNDELYATKPSAAFDEKFDTDNIKIVDKFDNLFSVEVPILSIKNNSVIRTDTVIFRESSGGYYPISVIECGSELKNIASDDEMIKAAASLIDEYNRLDNFTLMAGRNCGDESAPLPYTNGKYIKLTSKNGYDILSAMDLFNYVNSIVPTNRTYGYLSREVYLGTYPISFVDTDGKTITPADQSSVYKNFIEYNGSLYVLSSRNASNDHYYSAENAKIVSKGKNFFIAEIDSCSHSPGYPPEAYPQLFILTKDGYRFVG